MFFNRNQEIALVETNRNIIIELLKASSSDDNIKKTEGRPLRKLHIFAVMLIVIPLLNNTFKIKHEHTPCFDIYSMT